MSDLLRNRILLGDVQTMLRTLPDASVDCVVTSPPYFQLRSYFVDGQLGLEPTVHDWVNNLTSVFDEVARVLKNTGSLWLNLGDSFSRHERLGAPAKGLLCAPERLLLRLCSNGWIVRNKVIYAKSNPMPSSVADRLSLTYEVVYFLVRSPDYFSDLDPIREPHRSKANKSARPLLGKTPDWAGPLAAGSQDGLRRARPDGIPGHPLGKNPGDVWRMSTRGYPGHRATFPEELVIRPIKAGCPEKICIICKQPWRRAHPTADRFGVTGSSLYKIGDLIPCSCGSPTKPGVVVDPFMGSGTVAVVAEELGRDWIGVELNSDFKDLAMRRIETARQNHRMDQARGTLPINEERRAA